MLGYIFLAKTKSVFHSSSLIYNVDQVFEN